MFINVNGPTLSFWNPKNYVKSWLVKHRCAENIRSKNLKIDNIHKTEDKNNLWKISMQSLYFFKFVIFFVIEVLCFCTLNCWCEYHFQTPI